MQTGFLHTHILVNVLFMLLLAIKTVMLLANKTEQLTALRAKTKIADMVLGTLILVTGIYLLTIQETIETWMIVKTIIVIACIPLGIIGIAKGKKPLAVLSLIGFIYVYGVAETKSLVMKKAKYAPIETVEIEEVSEADMTEEIKEKQAQALLSNGQAIYEGLCVQCHGTDGKLGKYGAKNLIESTMTREEKIAIIKDGKGMMNGFGKDLKESEIEQILEYIATFSK
jgi:mono/diheme cytochrome c family protein